MNEQCIIASFFTEHKEVLLIGPYILLLYILLHIGGGIWGWVYSWMDDREAWTNPVYHAIAGLLFERRLEGPNKEIKYYYKGEYVDEWLFTCVRIPILLLFSGLLIVFYALGLFVVVGIALAHVGRSFLRLRKKVDKHLQEDHGNETSAT